MKASAITIGALASIILIFSSCIETTAQDPDSNQSSDPLAQLFADAVDALGSREALKRVRSIEVVADCVSSDGSNYQTEIHSFRSNKTWFKQSLPDRPQGREVFINRGVGWTQGANPNEWSAVSPGTIQIVHMHEYQRLALDFKSFFESFQLAGEVVFHEQPCVEVLATNQNNETTSLYFGTASKRLVGFAMQPQGSEERIVTTFREWTRIQDVELPSLVTVTDATGEFTLRFSQMTCNQADEQQLDVPPEIKD